jgi:GPH family glycoside/pentoside/hexuronide:cation symporter
MPHYHPPRVTPEGERVPLRGKIGYGLGSLTDFFYANVLQGMYSPIYVIAMKMDPALIGAAMAFTRVIGAATDPIVGAWSDNTRTRWGRRKPFILVGTIAGAILLPLLWRVPGHSPWVQTAYIIGILSFFSIFYSLFAVPWGALGLEQSNDYDERTRVFAVRNYIQTIAIFGGSWFYWFTLRPMFGNEIAGVQVLSLIGAAVMLLCMVAVLRGTRERSGIAHSATSSRPNKIPLLKALRLTFQNRAFLMIQTAALVVAFGTGIDGPIGMYLHVYYSCGGNKDYASFIGGAGGTLSTSAIYLAMPLGLWLSTRFGKREAASVGMVIMLIGTLSLPFTLNPHYPWLVVITWVTNMIGTQISGLMYASMLADICDDDELKTGTRREGVYVASASFLGKSVQVLVLLLGGYLPHLAGYTNFAIPPTPEKLNNMKYMLIGTSVTGILLSLWFIHKYPITRAYAEATRRALNLRAAGDSDAHQ